MREASSGGRRFPTVMESAFSLRLEKLLWPDGYRRDVWMLVDAARDPRIFSLLLESRLEHACLYSGNIPVAIETVAPYLVRLEYDDGRCQRFLNQAWGNSWGLFVKSDTTLERLRKHLRGFLTVRGPDGGRLLFRYYDPRVMKNYLPVCSIDQLRSIFGPIDRFTVEREEFEEATAFEFDGTKLISTDLALNNLKRMPKVFRVESTQPLSNDARPELMRIPREQMASLSQQEMRRFEDWMVRHLTRFFARKCRIMGEQKLLEIIRYGIRRAAFHKITAKRDVCKYIDLMIVFHREFDTDRELPWAGKLLNSRQDASTKMRALHAAGQAFLKSLRYEI